MKLPHLTIPHISMASFLDFLIIVKAIGIGALVVLILLVLNKAVQELQQTKTIGQQNRTLIEQIQNQGEQIKTLTQQNYALSQRDSQQRVCFAKAFAVFTQTHQAVNLDQIESCNIPVVFGGTTGSTKSA